MHCIFYSRSTRSQPNFKKNAQRISNLAPFADNYNRKAITFPAGSPDFKTFERNNKNIALNVLSVQPNKKELYTTYISKFNKEPEKQAIILMINENENEELEDNKYHYIAVKNLSRLCRNITSNHNGDKYCLNCLHSFPSKKSLEQHEKICHNHGHCQIFMPKEGKNLRKYNSGEKSLRFANTFYLDLECILVKQDSCENNPNRTYTEKKKQKKKSMCL